MQVVKMFTERKGGSEAVSPEDPLFLDPVYAPVIVFCTLIPRMPQCGAERAN